MTERVRVYVDGKELMLLADRMLLDALDTHGALDTDVRIPHDCWHPKLSIEGSCRLCLVEVEGCESLQIACDTPVAPDMRVSTKSERVRAARSDTVELLLAFHPLECAICDKDGECSLQRHAVDYGRPHARTREPRRQRVAPTLLGTHVVLDPGRCTLCTRCVRFCREIVGTGELGVFGRGDDATIGVSPGTPLDNPYSMNVTDLCPVGALSAKHSRLGRRVWELEQRDGICVGCARGCNVHALVHEQMSQNGGVDRYVPRRNDAVNESWLCDEGRLSYREIGRLDRLRACLVRDSDGVAEEQPASVALAEAAGRLRSVVAAKGAGVVAAVASAHASNEDLFELRRFLAALGTEVSGFVVLHGHGDDLLRTAELAPNAAGARAIGFGEAGPVVDRIRGGGVDALIVFGAELLDASLLGGALALDHLEVVIGFETHHSPIERVAHVVFPVAHAAEKDATYTNTLGRVQRVHPAIRAPDGVTSAASVLACLGAEMGLPGFESGARDASLVFAELAESVPAFAGLEFDEIGPEGRELQGGASAAGR